MCNNSTPVHWNSLIRCEVILSLRFSKCNTWGTHMLWTNDGLFEHNICLVLGKHSVPYWLRRGHLRGDILHHNFNFYRVIIIDGIKFNLNLVSLFPSTCLCHVIMEWVRKHVLLPSFTQHLYVEELVLTGRDLKTDTIHVLIPFSSHYFQCTPLPGLPSKNCH